MQTQLDILAIVTFSLLQVGHNWCIFMCVEGHLKHILFIPIIYFAFWTADNAISTLGPRLQKPCSSGGETCIKATSIFKIFLRNRSGISLRNTGMKSARPSFTASLKFDPMKRQLSRNIPTKFTQSSNVVFQSTHCCTQKPNASYNSMLNRNWRSRKLCIFGVQYMSQHICK